MLLATRGHCSSRSVLGLLHHLLRPQDRTPRRPNAETLEPARSSRSRIVSVIIMSPSFGAMLSYYCSARPGGNSVDQANRRTQDGADVTGSVMAVAAAGRVDETPEQTALPFRPGLQFGLGCHPDQTASQPYVAVQRQSPETQHQASALYGLACSAAHSIASPQSSVTNVKYSSRALATATESEPP